MKKTTLFATLFLFIISCGKYSQMPKSVIIQDDKGRMEKEIIETSPYIITPVKGIYVYNNTNWFKKAVKVFTNKNEKFICVDFTTNVKGMADWIKVQYDVTNSGWIKNELIWFSHGNTTEFHANMERQETFTYNVAVEDPSDYETSIAAHSDMNYYSNLFLIRLNNNMVSHIFYGSKNYLQYKNIGLTIVLNQKLTNMLAEYIVTNETTQKEIYHVIVSNYDSDLEYSKSIGNTPKNQKSTWYFDAVFLNTKAANTEGYTSVIYSSPYQGKYILNSFGMSYPKRTISHSSDSEKQFKGKELDGILSFYIKLLINGTNYYFSLEHVMYKVD